MTRLFVISTDEWRSCAAAACIDEVASQYSRGWARMPEDAVRIVEGPGLEQWCLTTQARKNPAFWGSLLAHVHACADLQFLKNSQGEIAPTMLFPCFHVREVLPVEAASQVHPLSI